MKPNQQSKREKKEKYRSMIYLPTTEGNIYLNPKSILAFYIKEYGDDTYFLIVETTKKEFEIAGQPRHIRTHLAKNDKSEEIRGKDFIFELYSKLIALT